MRAAFRAPVVPPLGALADVTFAAGPPRLALDLGGAALVLQG